MFTRVSPLAPTRGGFDMIEGYELRNGDYWAIKQPDALQWCSENWSFRKDYRPPKPLQSAEIASLGDRLDAAERADELKPWRIIDIDDPVFAYFIAVRDRAWFEV